MSESQDLQDWRSDLLRSIGLGVAYYVAAQLSLRLALVGENITPLWPPTGIALVGFLLRGRRLWPGVAIAAFVVNLPISATPVAAAVTAVGNTLAPLAAATLLLRVGFRPQLDRLRDALAIVFLAALGSTLISATIGATTLVVSDAITPEQFPGAWSVWWAGDAMGILVVAPFLLTLTTIREHPVPRGWKVLEAIALLGILVAISFLSVVTDLPILFLVFPVLGWAAWRFQQPGAAPAALLVSLFATWAAVEERGLFRGGSLADEMFSLQMFNAAVAFTSFFFAAVVSERLRSRQALEKAAAELEERVRERTTDLDRERAAGGGAIARATRFVGLGRGIGRRELVPRDVSDPRASTQRTHHLRARDRVRGARRSGSHPGERRTRPRGTQGADPRHRVPDRSPGRQHEDALREGARDPIHGRIGAEDGRHGPGRHRAP